MSTLISKKSNHTNTKKYVFIVTDRNRNNLHVGLSADILKTMDFYKKMPSLMFDASQQLTRLVYFEELNDEAAATARFNLLNKYTRIQKERMVRSVNMDWLDLTLALKHENLVNTVRLPQHILSFAS
nr:GIY-YIG nuclease family protein [uncultured Pedobacter sp.]